MYIGSSQFNKNDEQRLFSMLTLSMAYWFSMSIPLLLLPVLLTQVVFFHFQENWKTIVLFRERLQMRVWNLFSLGVRHRVCSDLFL